MEMERAVLGSRKTVLVLTSAYLNSEWAEFENILLQTMDPGARQRRLLPVVLQPCEIPLRIRTLVYTDFSSSQPSEAQFQRLIEALARDVPMSSGTAGKEEPLELSEVSRRIDATGRGCDHQRFRRTENLDARILRILYDYRQEHPGSPEVNLNELIGTLGAERADVIQCLLGLREKDWLKYSLTEGAESGLVWLTQLGTRVAKNAHRN
jgi:hypothetical protein